jgi:hypothetical protein
MLILIEELPLHRFYVWYEEMPFPLCDCTQNCIPNAAQSNWQAELMLGFQLLPVQSLFSFVVRVWASN